MPNEVNYLKKRFNDNDYISVIGGANIDVFGTASDIFMFQDSNPGEVRFSCGGVGRNLADNLSRLGLNVEFLTVFGEDYYAGHIKDVCRSCGISLDHCADCKDCNSSYYLCIEDKFGEMCAAISDMKIFDKIDARFINERLDLINRSRLCAVDTNLSEETLDYITRHVKVPIFIDTVSVTKSKKIVRFAKSFHTIKANLLEAESLSGMRIDDHSTLRKAAKIIMQGGVQQLFITLGKDGVYYNNIATEDIIDAHEGKIKNTTGAGDAFFSGVIWAYDQKKNIHEIAEYGQSAASVLMRSDSAVSRELTLDELEKEFKHSSIFNSEFS